MKSIAVNAISPQGQDITVDEQSIWTGPITEFHMDCRILEPVSVQLFVLPTDKGCLVRGHLTGLVALPCSRCAEDALVRLDDKFETFEAFPGLAPEEDAEQDEPLDEETHIVLVDSVPELDITALCWEAFSLALPVIPLCRPDCKGLCSKCGTNLNDGTCSCAEESGDPRLAALRNLKIRK